MSSISSAPPAMQPVRQAIIIPFYRHSLATEQFQPCIFCGKTVKVHKFKGKTVCIQCLRQIPTIFSCG